MLVKELVDKLLSQCKLNWAMYSKDDRTPIVKSFQIVDAASAVVSIVPAMKNSQERSPFKSKCCSDCKNLSLNKR